MMQLTTRTLRRQQLTTNLRRRHKNGIDFEPAAVRVASVIARVRGALLLGRNVCAAADAAVKGFIAALYARVSSCNKALI